MVFKSKCYDILIIYSTIKFKVNKVKDTKTNKADKILTTTIN